MRKHFKLLAIVIIFCAVNATGQDVNLDSMLDAQVQAKTDSNTQYIQATFKSTRLINGNTVETTQGGILEFKLGHRFGTLNEGFYNMWGFDVASMRLGFDYGVTNRFTVGVGRSSYGKQWDGSLKYRLLWQSEGKKNMPVSVTLFSTMLLATDTIVVKAQNKMTASPSTADKISYAYQILVARKFSPNFSLQLMPTLVHENLVDSSFNPNDIFAIGIGARFKLTQRSGFTVEYYYQLPGTKLEGTYNTFSLGYEIETGGHVFQVHLTNSTGMTENTFVAQNMGRWSKGDIHFGFNISRVFTIRKPKEIKM